MKIIKIGAVLFVICICISFALSTYVFYVLEGLSFGFEKLLPHEIYLSMNENPFHFMLFLSLSVLTFFIMVLLFIMGDSNYYKSELDNITDTISTPRSVGQLQHGSARWLNKTEQEQAFNIIIIDPKEVKPKTLLQAGTKEIAEVNQYKNKISKG